MNFDNKLKGLESQPDYPKDKPWYFRPGKDTNIDYNILSNIPMTEHHYDHPEKRPPLQEEKVQNTNDWILIIEIKNKKDYNNRVKRLQCYN